MVYKRPDIYIEEVVSPDRGDQGVSTSVAAFVGATTRGPNDKAILINNFDSFKRIFGGPLAYENVYYAVRSFFQNGGSQCYVVRIASSTSNAVAANRTLNNDSGANLLKFKAGYRGYDSLGVYGSNLAVDLDLSGRFVSNYVANTTYDVANDASVGSTMIKLTSISGISPQSVLKITEDVSSTPVDNYVVVRSVETKVVGGQLERQVNLTAPLAAAITAADSKIELLEYNVSVTDNLGQVLETWQNVSLNPDADNYIETVINDEAIGSVYISVQDLIPTGSLNETKEIIAGDLSASGIALNQGGTDELSGLSMTDIIGSGTTGFKALDGKSSVNLLCVPPSQTNGKITSSSDIAILHGAMLEYCGNRMDMFAILDAPAGLNSEASGSNSIGTYRNNTLGVDTFWGALYYPQLKVLASDGVAKIEIPPSGAVAGLYSRVDNIAPPTGGVSVTPAGYGDFGTIRGTIGLSDEISNAQHGDLNVLGVNCIKRVNQANGALPGNLVLGGRTLSSTLDFRYINVRRMMTYIEESVVELARPFLFKNNGDYIWGQLTNEIEAFLGDLFRSGQLFGTVEEQAYFVKIDSSNNPEEDMKQGILNAEIGVALTRPAEFIVFKFSQSPLGGSSVQE